MRATIICEDCSIELGECKCNNALNVIKGLCCGCYEARDEDLSQEDKKYVEERKAEL